MRTHLLLLIALTSMLSTSMPRAFADDGAPSLSAGFQLLRDHNYEQALNIFNAIARANPDSAQAHFGRAQALEALGRRQESVTEFGLVLALNPPQSVRDTCNRELDYMTTRKENLNPPTMSEDDVVKSTTDITKQAAERIRQVQSECSYSQRPVYVSRSRYSSRGSHPAPYYYGYGMASEAQQRARTLQECAEGLQSDMSTRPSAWDGIYLSPKGTNLYVRNYVTFDAQKPEVIEPVKAQEMSYADLKKQPPQKKK